MEGSLPLGEYLLGLAALATVLGAAGYMSVQLVTKRFPELRDAPRALGLCAIAVAAFILIHVLPAALGVLDGWSVLVVAAVGVLVAWRIPPRDAPEGAVAEPPGRSGPVAWLIALATAGVYAAVVVAVATRDATQASTGLDMVNFHLPDVATWIREGTIWEITQFVPLLTHGNYPQHGDFVLLAATLPFDNDFLVRLTMLPFLALLVFAIYVAARELRAPPAASLAAGMAVAAIPIVSESAVIVALPDAVMWSSFATGVAFLLRHSRTQSRADLVLAAVGLGIAFGAKWYGVSAVAIVIVVWAVASLLARRSPSGVARAGSILVGLIALLGGIWLLRNWVESGNPVFPVRVSALGITVFDAPFDALRNEAGFTIAGYLGDWSVWQDHLLPTYDDFIALPAVVLLGGVLSAGTVAAVRPAADRARVLALAACALLLAAMYSLLPYSAQGAQDLPVFAGPNTRYLVPSLIVSAPAFAWLARRFPRAEPVLVGAVAVAVIHGLGKAFDLSAGRLVLFLAAVAVVAGAAAWAIRQGRGPSGVVLGLSAAAIALVVAAAGYEGQQRFSESRYRGIDATYDWMRENAPSGNKVALAGNWSQGVGPPFPMFGPRLGNEVRYLGPWRKELLRRYGTEATFANALRGGRFDLLVVGRGFLAAPGAPPGRPVREELWARAAGLEQVARSDTLTLYRVPRSN